MGSEWFETVAVIFQTYPINLPRSQGLNSLRSSTCVNYKHLMGHVAEWIEYYTFSMWKTIHCLPVDGTYFLCLFKATSFLHIFLWLLFQSCFRHFAEQYETRLQALHRLRLEDMSQQEKHSACLNANVGGWSCSGSGLELRSWDDIFKFC